jgi:tRNA(fMet)-specific endonuclease VapC
VVAWCLDSGLLIGILRGDDKAVAAAARLDDADGELATTTINAHEILYGAHRSGRPHNVEEAETLLGRLVVLPLDQQSAGHAARLMADLMAKGSAVDLRDVLISSIALTRHCTLVTRNNRDFSKVKGLRVDEG